MEEGLQLKEIALLSPIHLVSHQSDISRVHAAWRDRLTIALVVAE